MTIIRAIDFETTGLPPDAAVCEIGYCDVNTEPKIGIGPIRTLFVDPERPIPAEASAVHHIIDADVKGALTFDLLIGRISGDADYFAAHNAAFERAFFNPGKPWICTLKAARRVWPEAPSHSLQVLRYWLGLPVNREAASPPHRAGPDAYVGAWLLIVLIEKGISLDDLVKWTEEPSLLPHFRFGNKHRGKTWAEVPDDYLRWMLSLSDLDEDNRFTAQHELKRRQETK